MTSFKPYKAELYQEKNVKVDFFEYEKKSIMLIKLTGELPDGSKAQPDCSYVKQQLTINLLAMRPISLLLDLSLLKYSFGNSLIDALSPLFELSVKTKIDTEDSFYNMPVIPPLITVDLIENAFKHADIQSSDSFINIVLECRNAYFKITVSNKISSQPKLLKENSGIGLQNLEKRLKLIYGNNYKLNFGIDGDSYVAQLKIDFKDATA